MSEFTISTALLKTRGKKKKKKKDGVVECAFVCVCVAYVPPG